jgi:GT2 family glycosyltransferase
MDKTILIGMPSGSGVVPIQMVQSLLMLHKPAPCGFMTIERQRVDKARNAIVMEALKGGFSHLFFVDDDNPVPPDTLEKLLEDDKDIVSAPILGRNPDKDGIHPLCCFYSREVEADGKPLRLYENITKFKEDGPLHKVDAVGTGCLLIKRKVLEDLIKVHKDGIFEFGDIKFKEKIWVDGKEYDRRTMSEDAEFSERAVDAGFEIWVDDRVRPFHLTGMGAIQYKEDK